MCDLTNREKQIKEQLDIGKTVEEIAEKFNLTLKTMKTYMSKIRTKLKRKSSHNNIRRCQTFNEFVAMINEEKVFGETLADRVKEFKEVYCKACPYPGRCNQCPTRVLWEKFLYED